MARNLKHLRDAFNLTLDQWNRILEHQGGVCAICKRVPRAGSHWHTDHDHKTGLVRGILCSQCNRALGKIEDPRWQWRYKEVYEASKYMANPPAKDVLGAVYGFPGKIGTQRYKTWLKKKKKMMDLLGTGKW